MKRQLVAWIVVQMVSFSAYGEELSSTPTAALADDIRVSGLGPDCAHNLPKLVELTSRADFAQTFDDRQQAFFLIHLTICMAESGQLEAALEYANRAAKVDPGSHDAQAFRAMFGFRVGKPADSVEAIEIISRTRPGDIRRINVEVVHSLLDAAEDFDGTGDLQLRIYDSLKQVAWAPPPPVSDDDMRVEHARLLVEHDRIEDARQRLATVADPEYVLAIRSDRTFDVLRKDAAFEAQLDFAASVPQSLARARTTMEQNPRMVAAVWQYLRLLEDALRFDEIVALSQTMLDRYESDPAAFDDAEGNLGWVLNYRIHALYSLGRFDDGQEAIKHAMQLQGAALPDEGNVINYAFALVWEGRPQEALEQLPKTGATSSNSRAWVESVRSCAGMQLGETATSTISLDYLRAHETDSVSALSTALLCGDHLDEAAALMIRRLANRNQRRVALQVLQIRPLTRFDELPFRKAVQDRMQALRERKDVRAAVRSVGRIEAVPVAVTLGF